MTRSRVFIWMAAALAAGTACAQFPDDTGGESFLQKPAGQHAGDDRAYEKGQAAIDARRWDQAVQAFSAAAAEKGEHADGALYWKAYALNKLSRREEALTTLAELRRSYANSRWLDDARALELEVRQDSGQKINPNAEPDEELQLLALSGLMNSDPERALPIAVL